MAKAWSLLLFVLAGAWVSVCRAEPPIYAFGDERGVLHLTNVPDDERYRPLEDRKSVV